MVRNLEAPMNRLFLTFVASLLRFLTVTPGLHAADDPKVEMEELDLIMPKSMDELIKFHLAGSDFGTWESTGVTKDMWVGIPAGLKYTNQHTMDLGQDGKTIVGSYLMQTEDGTVISTGSRLVYWDADAGVPKAANSGFDMGKPYSGVSVFKGMNEDTIVWEYTETSQGKKTTYLQTVVRVDVNTHQDSVRKSGGKGEVWKTTLSRLNHLKKMMGVFGLVGEWQFNLPGAVGQRTSIRWGLDGRILHTSTSYPRDNADDPKVESGTGIMYWDPVSQSVQSNLMLLNGMAVRGKVVRVDTASVKKSFVIEYEGVTADGDQFSCTVTHTLDQKEDTNTLVYSNLMRDGRAWDPVFADQPMVLRRVKSD